MKIKQILNQHRRDFRADFECEHCGFIERNKSGYDDTYYHQSVVPTLKCPECNKTAPEDARALAPKYPDGVTL